MSGAVLLRAWRSEDVPAIVDACRHESIAAFLPQLPYPYTEASARSWLESQEPKRIAGESIELAVADSATGTAVGSIAAANVAAGQRTAEVGYWLAPLARGHGHITQALRLLTRWLFDELSLERIELFTDPDNAASQRVAARCGFKEEARLRSHVRFVHSGRRRDSLVWGLLPGDLES